MLADLWNVWNISLFPIRVLTSVLFWFSFLKHRQKEKQCSRTSEDGDSEVPVLIFIETNCLLTQWCFSPAAVSLSCVWEDAIMCVAFNWISSALDRRAVGATRAFDITCRHFIWAATGSETQFYAEATFRAGNRRWKVQWLLSMKGWRPTEQ